VAWVDAPDSHERPLELLAGELVDRFGAQAVYGRLMGVGEMRAIHVAENVLAAYRGYLAALGDPEAGSAGWAAKHPELARVAVWALEVSGREAELN
jgi:hypothetical protein